MTEDFQSAGFGFLAAMLASVVGLIELPNLFNAFLVGAAGALGGWAVRKLITVISNKSKSIFKK